MLDGGSLFLPEGSRSQATKFTIRITLWLSEVRERIQTSSFLITIFTADWNAWDTASGDFHHDGIHFFTGGAGANVSNINIYNNRFDGHNGGSMTGFLYTEPSITLAQFNVFNNVMIAIDNVTNGNIFIGSLGDRVNVLSNTTVSVPPTGNVAGSCLSLKNMTTLTVKNNVTSTCRC